MMLLLWEGSTFQDVSILYICHRAARLRDEYQPPLQENTNCYLMWANNDILFIYLLLLHVKLMLKFLN